MMYGFKNNLFILIFSIYLVSCGYRATGEDKHRDMPIFPKHTNSMYRIDKLMQVEGSLIMTEDYLYAKTWEGSEDKLTYAISIFDRNLNKVKDIEISNYSENGRNIVFFVDSDNTIYFADILIQIAKDDPICKYPYPWDKKIKLQKIFDARDSEAIEIEFADILKERVKVDNKFYLPNFVDSVYLKRLNAWCSANEKCFIPLYENNDFFYLIMKDSTNDDSYSIAYSKFELVDVVRELIGERQPYLKYTPCILDVATQEPYEYNNENLITDQAVLGNELYGGKLSMEYQPYGFEYYTITTKNNDKIEFKVENRNLNLMYLHQLKNNFTNSILLRNKDSNSIIYIINKN